MSKNYCYYLKEENYEIHKIYFSKFLPGIIRVESYVFMIDFQTNRATLTYMCNCFWCVFNCKRSYFRLIDTYKLRIKVSISHIRKMSRKKHTKNTIKIIKMTDFENVVAVGK
jgi:hypothetical protein